ncbi:MAG: class I SAM-dependent methyltransferase [Candidatus Atabeyarchaeum deiterrae]
MSKCEICGGLLKPLEFATDVALTSDYRILRRDLSHDFCVNCGAVKVADGSSINARMFYRGYQLLHEETECSIITAEGAVEQGKYLVDFISPYLTRLSVGSLLDVGCGKGDFLYYLHEHFPNLALYGVEPSESFEMLSKRLVKINKFKGFFEDSPFVGEQFDIITLIEVLEHVDNPREFLSLIRKCMHNDTVLLVDVPNFDNNKTDLLVVDHKWKFTEGSLSNIFNLSGLRVIEKEVSKGVPMRYLAVKDVERRVEKMDVNPYIQKSTSYIERVVEQWKAGDIIHKEIFVYGLGLIYLFLKAKGFVKPENVVAFVDDNPSYWKLRLDGKPVIPPHDMSKYPCKTVFLAMNDCYHEKVLSKLKGYKVIR